MTTTSKSTLGLPVKYTWQGKFRYPLKANGHQWLYHDKNSWKIWRLKNRTPEAYNNNPEPLSKTAKIIWQNEVFNQIPQKYRNKDLFRFTKWLAEENDDQYVKSGLSVVLNSIVLDSTLKSFRIVTTFVDTNAIVHIQGLKQSEPQWFYLQDKGFPLCREEDMLVEPDLFLADSNEGITVKNIEDFDKAALQFQYSRVLHNYTITDFHVDQNNITLALKDKVTICPYEKGQLCGCIPVPGKTKSKGSEPQDVISPEVVVASPVVRKALSELSLIWQDRNPKKSVLISSPPGSGKEILCLGIAYGNGRPTENLQCLSMASDDQEGLEKLLFGETVGKSVQPGLIAKAAKSALFLDEVHQPEKTETNNNSSARSALLRPLEAGEFVPKGSSSVVEVDNVLFIMATSKSREELKAFNPPDFWTRMTHFVEIPHPLEIRNNQELDKKQITEVLVKFFNFFWLERVENFYQSKGGGDKDLLDYSEQLLKWQTTALHSVISKGWSLETIGEVSFNKLNPKPPIPGVLFAQILFKVLDDQKPEKLLPHECSIRGIRNMVWRLFYLIASRISQGEFVLMLPDEFETVVEQIAKEIVPIANISKKTRSINL